MKRIAVPVFLLFLLALPLLAGPAGNAREIRTAEGRFLVVRDPATNMPEEVRPVVPKAYAGEPETAAKRFLAEQAELLSLEPSLADVTVRLVRESAGGAHVWFRRQHEGLDVVNAYLGVHLDWDNRVFLVQQSMPKPDAAWPRTFPAYPAALAAARADFQAHSGYVLFNKYAAGKAVPLDDELSQARRVYYLVDGSPVAAWEIVLGSAEPVAEVTYWVGGDPLQVLEHRSSVYQFDGSGRVFLPNPVNTLGNSSLRDNSPDSAFTAAYFEEPMRDLNTPGPSGYALTGPWVSIVSLPTESPLVVPPTSSSGVFDFTRSQDGFEAANVYYWIDRSQRYIQSLGFNNIVYRPINIDVHGLSGADNSHYVGSPVGSGYIAYGDGGVDDAEDADIVLHEYGHAIMDSSNPGAFPNQYETGAIGEGFGDYWAFSQTYDLSVANGFDPFCIGEWDAKGYSPVADCLRRVDTEKVYPQDYVAGDIYASSGIWSSALKNLYLQLGGEVCDSIVLESHFLMKPGIQNNFKRGAQAMLQADDLLYSGAHHFEICQEFYKRGVFSLQDWQANSPVLEIAGLTLTEVEGNGNGIPEPGELVEVAVSIQNTGAYGTGSVLAQLQGPADLVFYEQDAGLPPLTAGSSVVDAGGAFQFWIDENAPCGASIPLTLALSFDGHVQTWPLTLVLGQYQESTIQSDNLESASSLWQTGAAAGSTAGWSRITYAQYHNGSMVWFTPDLDHVNDGYLVWGPINLPAGYYYTLSFWHTYSLESGYDGAVLELSTNGTTWIDLGPQISQNGYDSTISSSYQSPIGGRSAWTGGAIGAMKQVLVDLSAWAGQNVSVRFRMASDSSQSGTGWAVDDVAMLQQSLDCQIVDLLAGDLDDNGVRNAQDVMLLKALLGENLRAGQGGFVRPLSAADVNRDGVVDAADLLALLHLLTP